MLGFYRQLLLHRLFVLIAAIVQLAKDMTTKQTSEDDKN
jgi:hypothetical protein